MEQLELQPDAALQEKIAFWTQKRASFTAIAVTLYVIGAACLIGIPAVAAVSAAGNIAQFGVIGFLCCLVFVAIATGLLVYINMSMPCDVAGYVKYRRDDISGFGIQGETTGARFARSYLGSHGPICFIVYILLSFTTHAWHLTWLVFLIDAALVNAVRSFFGDGKENNDHE